MVRRTEIDPTVAEHVVADIVGDNLRHDAQVHESVREVYSINLMRELDGGLIEWPHDIIIAGITRVRTSDGYVTGGQRQFMLVDDHIVPLGTHTQQRDMPSVYRVNDACDITPTESLSRYIASHLSEVAVLTRVLSVEEAKKFVDGDPSALGSSYAPYWENVLHTAVHNVSSEFENLSKDAYGVAIKMYIPRQELIGLVDANEVRLDSYDWVFKGRSENSPLPFESEATFSTSSLATALKGYKTWAGEAGSDYFPNPFHSHD